LKAVVLVGGEGTRLRPLTYHTPKQLLRVVGFPMLERVLSKLATFGIDEAVLALGYQPDAFLKAYPDGTAAGVKLHYAVEEKPLDTAGAIRNAAEQIGIDETFLVINGDVLTDLDVGHLLRFHAANPGSATIGLVKVADPSHFGVVVTDESHRALRFVEKPPRDSAPSNDINAGIYVLEPEVLDRIALGARVSMERELFPSLVADGRLFATTYECYWVDAGTPRNYYRAAIDILRGRRRGQPVPYRIRRYSKEPLYLGRDVAIRSDASVVGSIIEDDVIVGEGARIVDSIVLEGAEIGPGATVANSIVGAETLVPVGAMLTEYAVVAKSSELEPGAIVTGSVPDIR
jgi:mannose-1-phosphate guanylyltransferase